VLIPFPKQRTGTSTESERSTELPEWKVQLQEKVRAIRARKGLEATAPALEPRAAAVADSPPEVAKGQNQRIEAALNRRRRPQEEVREAPVLAPQPPPAPPPQVVSPPQERHPAPVVTEPPRIERAVAYTEKRAAVSVSLPAAEVVQPVVPEARIEPETPPERPSIPPERSSTPPLEVDLDWDLAEVEDYVNGGSTLSEPSLDPIAETTAPPPLPKELLDPIGYATFFRRLYSALVDLGVVVFSCIPFVSCVELTGGDFLNPKVQMALGALALVIGFLYVTLMLTISGRTVGMMSAGLLVLDARTMDLPSFSQATLRLVGLTLGVLPVLLGCVWSLIDRERRTFSDLISRTAVRRVSESVYDSQEIRAPWLYRQRSRHS
jgi:uncharacterized RDD family membrane protein YckC